MTAWRRERFLVGGGESAVGLSTNMARMIKESIPAAVTTLSARVEAEENPESELALSV